MTRRLALKPAGTTPSPAHRAESSPAAPAPVADPVQLVVYGSGEPQVLEGTAETAPDGSVDIELPIPGPLPQGTPVQVILYPPGETVVIEGTVGPAAPDGSFEIIPLD